METIKTLLSRRSNSQLIEPIPSAEEMELVYQAAFRAPDHAWLRPWRFIEIIGEGRNKLGEAFLNSSKKIDDIDAKTIPPPVGTGFLWELLNTGISKLYFFNNEIEKYIK